MSDRARRRATKSGSVKTKRIVFAAVGGLALVVVACAAWIGVRLVMSYGQVSAARSEAASVVATLTADPTTGAASVDRLRSLGARLDDAHGLTSDVVWRSAEFVPLLGDNLRAYRLTVDALAVAVGDGLAPVAADFSTLAASVSLSDRTVDVAALSGVSGDLHAAEGALARSGKSLADAESGALVPPLASGVREAGELVGDLHGTVSALSTAVDVLPGALGADGAKRYALLFNNNAELRTTGGIAGAISELTTDAGRFELGRQLVPDDLNPAEGAGIRVTPEEHALFGVQLGEYIQNVNLTPDFVRSGELTASHWQKSQGAALDGVVSIDTASVSRLLAATGPVTVGGRTIDAANANAVLLTDVYREIDDRDDQDAFFGELTRVMFDKLFSSGTPLVALVKQLGAVVDEGRISVWFADPALQSVTSGGKLGGPLAQLSDDGAPVGVFFADGTAGKMDGYLEGTVTATCSSGKDGRSIAATATLASTAPGDITSAPWVVTGPGGNGLPATGHIRTMVQFAATDSLRPVRIIVDGEEAGLVTRMIDGRPVVVAMVDLAPGQVAVLETEFTVLSQRTPTVDRVVATPTATSFEHYAERGTCG
ncbi:DUF4012 domain-containing protein [Leifsonia shinshuensis]|uniref:DUF4012 domain-containing protein n=1 Tax=Leifsonia shinshuensis TaxID=150026 RepID=UPI001F5094E7|nr:DUF4012 domain-containing protein [Leifsonia shinshuensis]MCI0159228.1 DUF4012 domain-containing protein [Leifsonia shinshuensis]